MAKDLSYEDPEATFFITSRTIASRLWFVNNPKLEERVLAHLAKYATRYGVLVYSFVFMGNHYHLIAKFPRSNKKLFLQSFNAAFARLTGMLAMGREKGKLWARPPRCQALPRSEDIEHWMLYAALNPVSSGLVQKLSDYPSYNSFFDAISGKTRDFSVIDWEQYNSRKRFNAKLKPQDFAVTYTLSYERLPGKEKTPARKYREQLEAKAERRRQELIKERKQAGGGFAGREQLKAIKPGAFPRSTKSSTRFTKRPLVLSLCAEARQCCVEKYFTLLSAFRKASQKFRAGVLNVKFPPRTYRPPLFVGVG